MRQERTVPCRTAVALSQSANTWDHTEGYYTIGLIRKLFPMFELTPEGLEQSVKKLKTKR